MSDKKLFDLKVIGDKRGSLVALEGMGNIPFEIKRVYYIYGTQENVRRGFHAHKDLKQVAICVNGSCSFLLDDGKTKEYLTLNSPSKGLFIEGVIWREMYDFSKDCVLMVLANAHYDENDYIRDYNDFLKEVENDKK